MKFLNKVLVVLLTVGVISSCDNLDMDLQQDPNNIAPDQASLNDLYNNIQLEFRNVFISAEGNPGAMARMYQAGAFAYESSTVEGTFNGLWGNAYQDLFPDIRGLETLAEGQNFNIHLGSAKIMEGYALMTLVDLLGDVPYTESGQGTDFISPNTDDDQSVYSAALAAIDEGISLLTGTDAPAPAFDSFFGGNANNWITFGNTIKFKAALNMGDTGMMNSLISGGDLIDAADGSEDAAFHYGTQRNNPNSRHRRYNNHYEVGDGAYLSNYFMWLLRADKESAINAGATVIDPRIRYYFYRKVDDSVNQDPTTYSCHFSILPDQAFAPSHWDAVDPRLPYCVASSDGYSGRDHLNGEGIPPDGPIRTSWGLYPFGGDFDDDTFDDTRNNGTTGGLGEGIEPLMLASWTMFMQAEAALVYGTPGDPRALLEAGVRASLDKVESFEELVNAKMSSTVTLRDGSTGTVKGLFGMDQAAKDAYVDEVLALYDAASDPLTVVMKEFYIAAWGNGLEAYNMYRRTGHPDNLQPGLEPAFGQFPLTFWYPTNSIIRNSNISQKDGLGEPVFWQDAGVAATLY